jgi:SAM-dependent methyltransferase
MEVMMFEHVKDVVKANARMNRLGLLGFSRRIASAITRMEVMMFEHVKDVVKALETDPDVATRADAINALRRLGMGDFGVVLLSMPHPAYPKLSRLLPAMASEKAQRNWTGNHGLPLLQQTTEFVRAMSYNFARATGRNLDDVRILDYGCGYGRIARLMYYFTAEEKFFGVDPWDQAISLCHEAGLTTNFLVSDYLPESLPVGSEKFDLIYAFSVFTHLSHRAMTAALHTLRKYIADDGMLTITVRPIEYWQHDAHTTSAQKSALVASHRNDGFAFKPHIREAIDGDVTYGDTSTGLGWIEANFPEWEIKGVDRCLSDTLQRYVFMTPR